MTNSELIAELVKRLISINDQYDAIANANLAAVIERNRLAHEAERVRREIRRLEHEAQNET